MHEPTGHRAWLVKKGRSLWQPEMGRPGGCLRSWEVAGDTLCPSPTRDLAGTSVPNRQLCPALSPHHSSVPTPARKPNSLWLPGVGTARGAAWGRAGVGQVCRPCHMDCKVGPATVASNAQGAPGGSYLTERSPVLRWRNWGGCQECGVQSEPRRSPQRSESRTGSWCRERRARASVVGRLSIQEPPPRPCRPPQTTAQLYSHTEGLLVCQGNKKITFH